MHTFSRFLAIFAISALGFVSMAQRTYSSDQPAAVVPAGADRRPSEIQKPDTILRSKIPSTRCLRPSRRPDIFGAFPVERPGGAFEVQATADADLCVGIGGFVLSQPF